MTSAEDVIRLLRLEPHPEGGHYRETFRDPQVSAGRSVSTAIYYLLKAGERSRAHRIDAAEVWHWYAGSDLELTIEEIGEPLVVHRMGPGIEAGHRPQVIVPAHAWQSARSLGPWSLMGCTVAPGFVFDKLEFKSG